VASFTVVKLTAAGALDPTWGAGTGVVTHVLSPGTGEDLGASAVRQGPDDTTLVAGTDTTASGTPRGAIARLAVDGALDPRFGAGGVVHVARAGRALHITSMVRDRSGRIILAGTGRAPDSMLVRLRANGRRDTTFGTRGLTFRRPGSPPGGTPIYTRFEAVDVAGGKTVAVGSAAGPGTLVRGISGTAYTGRFALTVSRLR
jgi:uncharacterized delta-60 repeat protein